MYFKNFNMVNYSFGSNEDPAIFDNLTTYVDLLDQLRDSVTFYRTEYIQEDERPDQMSARLYGGNPNYHWTFFLVNKKLREQGWPVTEQETRELAKRRYPHWVVTTKSNIATLDKFYPGDRVEGLLSGSVGTVVERRLDLGQIIIKGDDNFNAERIVSGETSLEQNENFIDAIANSPLNWEAVHHYIDDDKVIIDIDPYTQVTTGLTPVTFLDRLIDANNDLKSIAVIRPESIEAIALDVYSKLAR